MLERRSIREYTDLPLTLEDVSQLLWAGQGITADWGGRTAPSAGALYPLEVYLVAGNVKNLSAGVYKYKPEGHELVKVFDGDVRKELAEAALSQTCVTTGTALAVGGRALTEDLRKRMTYSAYCDNMQHLEAFANTLYRSLGPLCQSR